MALSVLALNGCAQSSSQEATNQEERGTPVAAVEIQTRDLSREFSISGTVEPRVRTRLASRTAGTVYSVFFEEGDRVRQGDLLLQLDVSEQEAELARAHAVEEQARLEYERIERLRNRDISSAAEYEIARATLQIALSERRIWETRVGFGQVLAPIASVVTGRHVEPGEAVNAQDTLFELAALDELVVRIGVSELDVVHLTPGQSVPVTVDALPEAKPEGTIRRIFPTAEAGSRLIMVEVALPPDAAGLGIKPGFLARLRITVDQRRDVLAVPSPAIGQNYDESYVLVIDDSQLERRVIQTGVSRGQWTEVLTGLKAGEIVLASNPIDRNEGERVRVVTWRGQ